MQSISRFAVGVALAMGCFLLWNDSIDEQVVGASALSALLGVLFVWLTRSKGGRPLQVDMASFRPLLSATAELPMSTWRTGVFFVGVLRGKSQGGRRRRRSSGLPHSSSPAVAGRRALAVLAECLAPDSFAFAIHDGQVFVIHGLGVRQ